MYAYFYKPHVSTKVNEASFCSGQESLWWILTAQSAENKWPWILSSKRGICIKPSSQLSGKDHGTYQKFRHWGSKSWKDKGYYNMLSIGHDMASALEFTTELINYIRHKHDWPPRILVWLVYDLFGLPLINEDLVDMENYRGRKNHYSLVLQLLKLLVSRLPMLPHTCMCVCMCKYIRLLTELNMLFKKREENTQS